MFHGEEIAVVVKGTLLLEWTQACLVDLFHLLLIHLGSLGTEAYGLFVRDDLVGLECTITRLTHVQERGRFDFHLAK